TVFELPDTLKKVMQKAKKLEWITVAYLVSVIVVMYTVLGASQAMKAAWLEDVLSMIPAVLFLVATRFYDKNPNPDFPYGYHRVFSIVFLAGSVALFGMGLFLLVDSIFALASGDHPTIGSIYLFGNQIWFGWIMILALLYSAIPAMILGHKKLPLTSKLHNKILYTDAAAQKADYMTAFAAILGIIGIGFGFWWADAAAAIVISLSILKDGFQRSKIAILDLMDRYPQHISETKKDELVQNIKNFVKTWPNVTDANVRFREHGQVYFGEVAVIFKPNTDISEAVEEGVEKIREFDWKIYDVVIVPVKFLPKW
ncbi:MAG TPA: cation diffusion facilitator family transporter, partial [Flavobacteriaceae bacterium]|nr:cation diffusion facilitator family transporter [Flavobacteriaceae bacterium]